MNALSHFDKLQPPLISVVMPVYNCESFVEEAVSSILSQTLADFEFIIIDDGSTDNTGKILQLLAKQDSRIRLYHQNNKGLVYSLNKAIKLSRGRFIARMDADDISVRDRFERQIYFMNAHPDVYILGGWAKLFGEINEVWHHRQDDNFIRNLLMFRTSGFQHSSVLIRKTVFDKYEYESQWPHIEDAALWCKIAANERWKFHNLRCILVYYRTHHQQVSEIYREIQSAGFAKITEQYVNQLGGDIGSSITLWRKIIELSAMNAPEVITAGSVLNDIKGTLNLFDEFFVIEERWLKICLVNNVSHHIYKSHGPCRNDFVFLAESQLA
ncbi:glycosyltransferase family 2 protein [Aeromonas hydrophila]|uniref:glycosyltransferase family 2 protein n=1 Tax=Aeromonas hydrophila TaxID=644 RepID=UPI002B27160E|nr:glycosyltransferase family 2 protein [Aeromonas hydrophila]